ncbi:MAG: ankyrin repeat domain-containing protein [Holosporales bacterium]|jgi:ankyrin repeat protein|nr:ankyrin repeat domain-containing protein [Holosporales bacterium]
MTPIQIAAAIGNLELVTLLIKAGASIKCEDYWSITPLSVAASCGWWWCDSYGKTKSKHSRAEYIEIVRLLIENGAEVDTREQYGITPLTRAVRANCPEIVKMLVDKGAKVFWSKGSHFDEDSPIIIAKDKRYKEIQQILGSSSNYIPLIKN